MTTKKLHRYQGATRARHDKPRPRGQQYRQVDNGAVANRLQCFQWDTVRQTLMVSLLMGTGSRVN